MKNKTLIILVLIVLILIMFYCASETYSRYQTTIPGNLNTQIASFNVRVNDSSDSSIDINLEDSVISNEYSTNKVIPGSMGATQVELDFSDVQVACNYSLVIDRNSSSLPTNIKFYSDDEYTNEIQSNTLYSGSYDLDEDNVIIADIYWKWVYTNTNENSWIGEDISLALDVVVTQQIEGD